MAAAVVQMVVLEASTGQSEQICKEKPEAIIRRRATNGRRNHGQKAAALSAALDKQRQKFMWLLVQSLTLLCQLTFGNHLGCWDMKSVMNFLLLSRLNYADFKEAVKFF